MNALRIALLVSLAWRASGTSSRTLTKFAQKQVRSGSEVAMMKRLASGEAEADKAKDGPQEAGAVLAMIEGLAPSSTQIALCALALAGYNRSEVDRVLRCSCEDIDGFNRSQVINTMRSDVEEYAVNMTFCSFVNDVVALQQNGEESCADMLSMTINGEHTKPIACEHALKCLEDEAAPGSRWRPTILDAMCFDNCEDQGGVPVCETSFWEQAGLMHPRICGALPQRVVWGFGSLPEVAMAALSSAIFICFDAVMHFCLRQCLGSEDNGVVSALLDVFWLFIRLLLVWYSAWTGLGRSTTRTRVPCAPSFSPGSP